MLEYLFLPNGSYSPKPTDGLRHLFAQTGVESKYRKGQVLMRRGEIPDHIYLVSAGRVFSVHYTATGERRILNVIEAGNAFGTAEMLTGRSCGVTYVAGTDVTVRKILCSEVKQKMQVSYDAVLRIIENIVVNFEIGFTRVLGNMELDVGVRLANTMLDMAAIFGLDENGTICIEERPTQSNLADLVGSHRVTVNKELTALKKLNLVEVNDMAYRILDLEGLVEWRDKRIDKDNET